MGSENARTIGEGCPFWDIRVMGHGNIMPVPVPSFFTLGGSTFTSSGLFLSGTDPDK